MNFLSVHFLIFLPLALILWWGLTAFPRMRVLAMVLASLVFYADDYRQYLPVLLAYCVVDWGVGIALSRRPNRLVLAAGIGFNLAVLCFWKYTPLVVGLVDIPLQNGWVIPLGISFYAFSGISYMVDVYRRETPAEFSLARYALFATFFPHLVAGPILRAREFLAELKPERLPLAPDGIWEGAFLIARGAFKKAVLGDGIAAAIDPYFAHLGEPTTAGIWSLPYLYLYALQIYFDFSGYTDIARGLGLWFGFRWPQNFDRPYLALSIQDFWRRWHMTLSRFLRDYLYIPLGGNRQGLLRMIAAIMATMLLGGLWHGSNWTFLVWGGLHGFGIIAHTLWIRTPCGSWLRQNGGVIWRLFSWFLTFHAVVIAWAFFRISDIGDAFAAVAAILSFSPSLLRASLDFDPALMTLIASYGVISMALGGWGAGQSLQRSALHAEGTGLRAGLLWGTTLAILVLAWLLAPSAIVQPFIYFQF